MATSRKQTPAAAPAVQGEKVNQFAREIARMGSADYPHAGDRYGRFAMALGVLAETAKPGTVVRVRFAQVNALTGDGRGEREGCDVRAQWVRGVSRLYKVFGAAGLAPFGVAGVEVDGDSHLAITRA